MVKKQWIPTLLLLLILPLSLFCQEVTVTAEIDEDGVVEMPIKGSITVTHDQSLEVDMDSFRLDDDPIKVEFLKEVRLSPRSPLIISIYNFHLDPQPVGLQVLPEISVTVGGKAYSSISSTYKVVDRAPPSSKPTKPSAAVVLKLETIVDGDTTLYPGQRITVGYRFLFNYSVDLVEENIPLLEAKGFRKIGGKETKDFTKDSLNVFEATQVIQAIEPGEYSFKPGILAGRAYRTDRLGRKEYAKTESRAESQSLTIQVLPFPEEGKPTSFNGAVGETLEFSASLLTSNEVTVGDKMELLLTIEGNGELAGMPMPEVCCQPGYSGFFRLSDLPPMEEVSEMKKTFSVEMRPLNALMAELPSLEFSYFNSKSKKYTTLRSAPISITVTPLKRGAVDERRHVLMEPKKGLEERADEKVLQPEPIEIEGNVPLTSADLENLTFGTWWVLLFVPFGISAILLQINMRGYIIKQQQRVIPKQSKDFFQEAFKEGPGSPRFFQLLHHAFLLRLVERGDILSAEIPIHQLSESGVQGKVRAFLHHIEEKRFSGKEEEFGEKFFKEAKMLFREIK